MFTVGYYIYEKYIIMFTSSRTPPVFFLPMYVVVFSLFALVLLESAMGCVF